MSSDLTGLNVVDKNDESIRDKVFLITGPSPESLGACVATTLCTNHNPALLILVGRSSIKTQPVIESIREINPSVKVVFVSCDLTVQSSVREAGATINALTKKIHVVINSAAIMVPPIYENTAEGIEIQFATNHVGPFLLTNLVLSRLVAAGEQEGARIVNLTSTGYLISDIRYDDINFENGSAYNAWVAYGQSKTASILFSLSLAEKLAKCGIQAYSVHPGQCHTQLQKHLTADSRNDAYSLILSRVAAGIIPAPEMEDYQSFQEAIYGVMRAALDPDLKAASGAFLVNGEPNTKLLAPYAVDSSNAANLWQLTEELVGEKFLDEQS